VRHIPSDYIEDAIAETQAYHVDCPPVRVVRVSGRIVVYCEACTTTVPLDDEDDE
jgi:hypothetical protein